MKHNVQLPFGGVSPAVIPLRRHQQPSLNQSPLIPIVEGCGQACQVLFEGGQQFMGHHCPVEVVVELCRPQGESDHP